ncbi:type IV secretion system protein [Rugamonas sp. A1-17]|nr:type IV secretion system protein [Rugamonas sp. A1-17]
MSSNTKPSNVPSFNPHTNTEQEYFDRGAGAVIERNRWFLVSILLSVALIVSGAGWYVALPLKTVEAYAVNKVEGGRLVTESQPFGNWTPDKDSIGYFLNQWANNLYDVNRSDIDKTMAAAAELAIGDAAAQMKEFRAKDNPLISLQNNLSYSRTYEFITINFIEDNVGFLRFKTTTRKNSDAPVVTTYAMKITFTRIKPTTREQVMKNPAGLFITNFNATVESTNSK